MSKILPLLCRTSIFRVTSSVDNFLLCIVHFDTTHSSIVNLRFPPVLNLDILPTLRSVTEAGFCQQLISS